MGWQQIRGRPLTVQAKVQNIVIASSGDLAYTVGFESGPVRVDRGREQDMTIRVTHIYRRGSDGWKLIHRHADFPPPDQRHR
ncbi:MAG: nuclear transport factor 2 family protein [Solirubrobacterales bacterium]|nr:nuclear transport factor 2 family protein [Solirubrobacterales bacterium]MBV9421532.1 nuclear transport factor 2 family protein [Solirubrobacterales bacterium]